MGFEVKRTTTVLDFSGTDLDGAEVRCNSVSMDVFFDFARMQELEEVRDVQAMLRRFGDEVVASWNLELDGAAVPANGDGIMQLPLETAKTLLVSWTKAVSTVPAPLAGASGNGSSPPPVPEGTLVSLGS